MSYNKTKTDIQVALGKWVARRSVTFQRRLGQTLGRLFYYVPNKRKHTAQINIGICFPELNQQAAKELVKKNLIATGQGVIEMLAALWAKEDSVSDQFEIVGTENLRAALADGEGCLMLSCHTTSIEWGIRGLNHWMKSQDLPVGHMLARQHNNKILEAHLEQARLGFVNKLIDKKNIRSLLKSIKTGHPVYYAPDQNFSYQVEFADFFNRPAATTIGTHKLAQKGVNILPWFCFRTAENKWLITILPLMNDLSELTEKQAAQVINHLFEHQIKKHPEQYLWVHRRFKNQPEGFENPYK